MADHPYARIERLEAENAALREQRELDRAEIVAQHAEAERRDHALVEALEQQTATSEVLRHFCRLMGGDLTVESAYGQGSTFTVRLPVEVTAPVAS